MRRRSAPCRELPAALSHGMRATNSVCALDRARAPRPQERRRLHEEHRQRRPGGRVAPVAARRRSGSRCRRAGARGASRGVRLLRHDGRQHRPRSAAGIARSAGPIASPSAGRQSRPASAAQCTGAGRSWVTTPARFITCSDTLLPAPSQLVVHAPTGTPTPTSSASSEQRRVVARSRAGSGADCARLRRCCRPLRTVEHANSAGTRGRSRAVRPMAALEPRHRSRCCAAPPAASSPRPPASRCTPRAAVSAISGCPDVAFDPKPRVSHGRT